MADKLIFSIGFDLEAAIKKAEGDSDRLLRRLETTIKSRPLAINLKINLLPKILLGSLDNLCNRKKKLRADDGDKQANKNTNQPHSSTRSATARTCGWETNKTQEHNKQTNNNSYIAQYLKETTRAVEFFNKVLLFHYIYFYHNRCNNQLDIRKSDSSE